MKRNIFILLFLAVIAISGEGAKLTPEASLARIEGGKQRIAALGHKESLRLKYSEAITSTGEAGLYVFADDEGQFVIGAADDTMPALLGYGEHFDSENIPDGMKWWMEMVATMPAVRAVPNHSSVATLMRTTWNQNAPFNNLCPTDGGGRAVTGCVATAVAQVVRYHALPEVKGIGTHSYTWNNTQLTFDYANTTFDWSNMLNSYSNSYNTTQANAVATLMRACGIGVEMNYSSVESGAAAYKIENLLVNNLGFDKGAAYLKRSCFSAEEWDEVIYGEILAGRPVIYTGYKGNSGHCFVCDGYSSNGYYHINWGWGGLADGNYLLTKLEPTATGIGAGQYVYNDDQEAVIGIQSPRSYTKEFLPVISNGGFDYSDYYNGFWFGKDSEGNVNGFFNYSNSEKTYTPGVRIYMDDGTEYFAWSKEGEDSFKPLSGLAVIRVNMPENIKAGTYKVMPVVRRKLESAANVVSEAGMRRAAETPDWQKIYIPTEYSQYATIRVGNNGLITYDGSDPDAVEMPVTVTDMSQYGEWIADAGEATNKMRVSFKNNSNAAYTFPYRYKFVNDKTSEIFEFNGYYTVTVAASQTYTGNFGTYISMPAGVYRGYSIDGSTGAKISADYTFIVGTKATNVTLDKESRNIYQEEHYSLAATVYPEDAADKDVMWSSDNPSVATVDDTGTVQGQGLGSANIYATTAGGAQAVHKVNVILYTSVDELEGAVSETEHYYNLQGIEIDSPIPGNIYIVRGKGESKKIMY